MINIVRKKVTFLCFLLLTLFLLVSAGFAQENSSNTQVNLNNGNPVLTPVQANRIAKIDANEYSQTDDPSLGELPGSTTIATRRDAGSNLLAGLTAAEITQLTIDPYGLSPAIMENLSLGQDGTNWDPYDNLNDGTTFFTTLSVGPGAIRLVAETFESTAANINLFVGSGSLPTLASEICASIGDTAVEQCNIDSPAPGVYWILVQNRAASAFAPDAVKLAYAVVTGDAGNMWAIGPSSVPEQQPFDLRIFWDEPAFTAGDRWYGAVNIGSNPASPGDIGLLRIDLHRLDDDVKKTVNTVTAVPGDVLNYSITIQPNVTDADLATILTDTIPVGLTYIPNSVSTTGGSVNVTGNKLVWSGVMSLPNYTYNIVTSLTEPTCAPPLAGADGDVDAYLDLAAFNIVPDPNIIGNSVTFSVNFDGGAYDFFGSDQGDLLYFTDDGFAFFAPSTAGATPWLNEPIPTPAEPNNLLALLWRDMEISYDAGLNRGVSLVNLTSNGVPFAGVVEFDDIEASPIGTGLSIFDLEIIAYYDSSPQQFEYIFAFDNIRNPAALGTIGLEDAAGMTGVQYAHNDVALVDGMAICFDRVGENTLPIEITYQALVDESAQGILTNGVIHNTNNPGSQEAETSVGVQIVGQSPTKLLISSNSYGVSGGVAFTDEDILSYDLATGEWAMYFDGSDLGLRPTDVDAVHFLVDGGILMSFNQRIKIPGFGKVDDSDIVKFIPTSLGENTAGSFEWYFDGSDVGLTRGGEDVDAISITPDGRLLVSTNAAHKVFKTGGGVILGIDDDLLVFNATSLGENTSGDWELYFHGRDVGLKREDIWGAWLDAATGDIYLSLQSGFNVVGANGDSLDIVICHPVALGEDTECTFGPGLFFDGSFAGFGGHRIDGFSLGH
jgi:uncharacterized repeat protein (TIGR01451 family)